MILDLLNQPFLLIILSAAVAFTVTFFSVPSIVDVARKKHLYDVPNGRTSHIKSTPTLGGMAIYVGLIISTTLFVDITKMTYLQYVIAGSIIIFFIGLKDDILSIAPFKKLLGQLAAAYIIIDLGNVRFTTLHGFLGIYEINYFSSVLLSLFVIIVTINAFNLIDGIDGLASSIGVLVMVFFGTWFYLEGHPQLAIMAAALAGALLAFFRYNVYSVKNKIFMGDIGSLTLGFFVAVLLIRFNEINALLDHNNPMYIEASPVVSFGVLILPMFDTLRVFVVRIYRGVSPFKADRTHLHHVLLDLGASHKQATAILIAANLFFILVSLAFHHLGIYWLGLIILSLALILSYVPFYIRNKRKQKQVGKFATNGFAKTEIKPKRQMAEKSV